MNRWVPGTAVGLFVVTCFLGAACTESATGDLEDETPDGERFDGSARDAARGPDAARGQTDAAPGARDAAPPTDVVDAGPDAPECVPGDRRVEPCGRCGQRESACTEGGVFGGFGSCRGEPAQACDPGTTQSDIACGSCGHTSRTCSATCEWQTDACVEDEDCNGPRDGLVLPLAPGAHAEAVFSLGAERMLRLLGGGPPCTISGPPRNTVSNYTYIQVHNPGAVDVRAELRVGRAPNETQVDVLVAAYATKPADETVVTRAACLTGAENNCFSDFDYLSCLIDSKAPIVPAGSSIWVYVGNFHTDDPAAPFLFRATTIAL